MYITQTNLKTEPSASLIKPRSRKEVENEKRARSNRYSKDFDSKLKKKVRDIIFGKLKEQPFVFFSYNNNSCLSSQMCQHHQLKSHKYENECRELFILTNWHDLNCNFFPCKNWHKKIFCTNCLQNFSFLLFFLKYVTSVSPYKMYNDGMIAARVLCIVRNLSI